MTSRNTRRVLIAALTGALLLSPEVVYAADPAIRADTQPDTEYYSAKDSTGESWTVSSEPLDQRQLTKAQDTASTGAHVMGRPLPPANWRACAWNAKEDKLVHSYLRIRVRYGHRIKGTHASLECGNKHFGYKHILDGHRDDWSQESWYINQNWRDLAGFSIKHILKDPDKVVSRKDKTWCWSRAIFLYKGNEKVKTIYPKVGLGTTGRRIITAFPSGSQCKGKSVYPN